MLRELSYGHALLRLKTAQHQGVWDDRDRLIYGAASRESALPNPPAALRQQRPERPVLMHAHAGFYNCYPWGAFFCTLSPAQLSGGSTALPRLANSPTLSRRSGPRSAGCGDLRDGVPQWSATQAWPPLGSRSEPS